MSKASRAREDFLKNAPSLKYGDYNVDQTWKYALNPLAGHGGAGVVAFNPNDPTQKFTLDDANSQSAQDLSEYLNFGGGNLGSYTELGQWYGDMAGDRGAYSDLFGIQSIEKQAEQKRLADLAAKISSGQLSATQGTQMANTAPTPVKTEAQNIYDQAKTASKSSSSGSAGSPKKSPNQPVDYSKLANGLPPDDPSNQFNTLTGERNPNYNPAAPKPQGNQEGGQPQPGSTAPTPFFSGANLSQGSRGEAVKQLQQAIGGIAVDGVFGPKTMAAVKQFQLSHGLKADGIVGPQTMAALNAPQGSPIQGVASGISSGQDKALKLSNDEPEITPLTGNPTIDTLLDQLKDASPQKTFSEVYKQIYKDMGIDTIKKDYEAQTKGFTDLQDKKNDEIQKINNNPWYSEGVRVAKLRALDAKYEGKELIFTNKLKLLENTITQGREEAQFIAGQTMTQINKAAELNQDIILKAIDLIESTIEAEGKLEGPASVQEYKYAVSQGYTGTFNEYQNEDANRKAKAAGSGLGGMFSASQINSTINAIAGSFDNEPVVKEYNTIARALETYNNLGSSATDDIQRVYTFAKVADPTSAVKEGEYNSIEKYSQALLQRAGLKVNRVFSATGILTPEARAAMGRTLTTSLNSAKKTYDNVYSNYQRRIEQAKSGQGNSLTDYSTGYTQAPQGIQKGSLSSAQYVEKVLSSQGLSYNSVVSQIPKGQIGVIDNQTGEIGFIPENEFSASAYTRI